MLVGDVVGDVTSHVENKPFMARMPSTSKWLSMSPHPVLLRIPPSQVMAASSLLKLWARRPAVRAAASSFVHSIAVNCSAAEDTSVNMDDEQSNAVGSSEFLQASTMALIS